MNNEVLLIYYRDTYARYNCSHVSQVGFLILSDKVYQINPNIVHVLSKLSPFSSVIEPANITYGYHNGGDSCAIKFRPTNVHDFVKWCLSVRSSELSTYKGIAGETKSFKDLLNKMLKSKFADFHLQVLRFVPDLFDNPDVKKTIIKRKL